MDCVSHCRSRLRIHSNIYTEAASHLWHCVELFGGTVVLRVSSRSVIYWHLHIWARVQFCALNTAERCGWSDLPAIFLMQKYVFFKSALVFWPQGCAFGLCRYVPEIITWEKQQIIRIVLYSVEVTCVLVS